MGRQPRMKTLNVLGEGIRRSSGQRSDVIRRIRDGHTPAAQGGLAGGDAGAGRADAVSDGGRGVGAAEHRLLSEQRGQRGAVGLQALALGGDRAGDAWEEVPLAGDGEGPPGVIVIEPRFVPTAAPYTIPLTSVRPSVPLHTSLPATSPTPTSPIWPPAPKASRARRSRWSAGRAANCFLKTARAARPVPTRRSACAGARRAARYPGSYLPAHYRSSSARSMAKASSALTPVRSA